MKVISSRHFDLRRVRMWALVVLLITLAFGTVHRFRGWDQTFYLAQTSSLVEDGDLDLRNDVLHGRRALDDQIKLLTRVRPNGALLNTFPIGPSLLWTPAYALSLPLRGLLAERPEQRWSRIQLVALHLLNLGLLLALVWSLDRWLRRLGAPRRFAAVATVALVLGTSLLVYGFRQYTTSHLATVLAVTWLVAAAFRVERRPSPLNALLCGLALGAVFLCRWQDVLKGALLLIPLWHLWRRGMPLRRLAILSASVTAGALAVASLQLHGWILERGRVFALPQGSGYMSWADPELARFLFSGLAGLVPWSPIFVLGLLGLCLPWRGRGHRLWAVGALALVLVDLYVNAAVDDWWGGAAYGSRRMISSLPLLAIGLANLGVRPRWRGPATVLLVLCCLWGTFTANLYVRGIRDLAPVFTGRPSDAPGSERERGVERTPEAAREIARTFPVRYRGIDYFRGRRGGALLLGRLATVGLMAVVLWLSAAALGRTRRDRLLPATLTVLLGLVLLGHLRLATGPHPDREERHLWGDLSRRVQRPAAGLADLEPRIAESFADPADRFADPRRYVWAWALRQHGRLEEARRVAGELEGRPYPSVEDLLAVVELEPGLRLLKSLPGVFLEVEGGRRRRVTVPGPLDLSRVDLTVAFALRDGEPLQESRLLLAWRLPASHAPDGAPVATLAVTTKGELLLRTSEGVDSAPFRTARGVIHQVELGWLHERGMVKATVKGADGERVSVETPLAVESGTLRRWTLVFGLPSGWGPEVAPEGAVYSGLTVASTAR